MSRREFPKAVKVAAWERAGGRCQHPNCGKKLFPGDIFYDHVIPDGLGGEPTLDNCQVLCRAHHDPKTRAVDVPTIAKMKRQHAKHIGATSPSSRGFQTNRNGPLKKTFSHGTVRRNP